MSKRQVRRMLRDMASGGPVEVTCAMTTLRNLARLAWIARQFGYDYADVRQGGGPQGNGFVLSLVPDPGLRPRARFPDADGEVALPPPDPAEVELLRTRIAYDLSARSSPWEMTVVTVAVATVSSLALALRLGADATAFAVAGVLWAGLLALLPALRAWNRRFRADYGRRLAAAGFRRVTDPTGRVRYLPPPAPDGGEG